MTKSIYEGDPKMINGANGTRFQYSGGQPIMDAGVENSISIDLGTKSKGENSHQNGWVGNWLLPQDQKIGSDYQDIVEKQPGTLAGLARIEQAAKKALTGAIYGQVESVASNPEADTLINNILVNPPAGVFVFQTKFSQNWKFQSQKVDPGQKSPQGSIFEYKDLISTSGQGLLNESNEQLLAKVKI